MTHTHVVEIVTFGLKPGVAEEQFLQAAAAVQPDIQKMSGYINRELLKDEHGQWIDLLHWRSMEEALAAAETLMSIPNAGPFIAMIDETNMTMRHLRQIRRFDRE